MEKYTCCEEIKEFDRTQEYKEYYGINWHLAVYAAKLEKCDSTKYDDAGSYYAVWITLRNIEPEELQMWDYRIEFELEDKLGNYHYREIPNEENLNLVDFRRERRLC